MKSCLDKSGHYTERLNSFGIENITAKIFDINIPLSQIDKVDFLK